MLNKNEEWKDIINFEGLYQISNRGRVKSLQKSWLTGKNLSVIRNKKESYLRLRVDKDGYLFVLLRKNTNKKFSKVHRLMGIHFLYNKFNKPQINHIDGYKKNNDFKNLEWVTSSENIKHALQKNLIKTLERSINSKIVYQYDLNSNFIKKWECVKTASTYLNINKSSISNNCGGRYKTAGGFIWSYQFK